MKCTAASVSTATSSSSTTTINNNYNDDIIDFCERNGLIVTNTWFKKPKRRLYTWNGPVDWSEHQLDYILVKHRYRNSVKDVQTLPGADIDP